MQSRLAACYEPAMTDLLHRHIRACNNAVLPGGRLPFRRGRHRRSAGSTPALADRLMRHGVRDRRPPICDDAGGPARAGTGPWRKPGLFRWRDEAFDVRANAWDGPVLGTIDRGALPGFGMQAIGVHLNGLVRRPGRTGMMWVGRRAPTSCWTPASWTTWLPAACSAGMTSGRDAGEGSRGRGKPADPALA